MHATILRVLDINVTPSRPYSRVNDFCIKIRINIKERHRFESGLLTSELGAKYINLCL